MACTWPGLSALLSENVVPPGGTIVMLGVLDSKKGYRIAGAVLSPSQKELVNDIVADGGIAFESGMEYNPFEEVSYDPNLARPSS